MPPDEGVELADVDSLRDGRSMLRHSASEHASMPPDVATNGLGGFRKRVRSPQRPFGLMILVPYTRFLSQIGCGTRSVDDYCACVQLQNGRLAGWSKIGCSCWQIPEGGRVLPFELRYSIVSTMALELPSFLADLEDLRGMSPNVI